LRRQGELQRGRYLEQLLEALPYPLFVKDRFGVYIYCNAAFAEAVGKHREEVLGLTIFDLVPPESAQLHVKVEEQLGKRGGLQIYEVPLASPEGGLRLWRLHKVSVRGRSNEPIGFAGLMTPSRELARKTEPRKSRRAELAEVETMLAVVAHELHSPIASIRTTAELLSGRKLPAAQRRHLVHLIHQQAYRMGEVLSDLVDVTRLHLGSADWHWQEVELGNVLEPCVESARTAVQDEPGMQFSVRPAERPVWIEGDLSALRRLVNALLSNAIRYTGSGEIELAWGAVEEPAGEYCWITVRDTGPGLPMWVLESLDRPFSLSCGLIGAKQASGTGLGLTLAKGIIEAHQGLWEIESAQGAGTRFRILLPRSHRRMRRANSES
jgi:two-component system aerobic respiration control sensor histidine kinase ArcB